LRWPGCGDRLEREEIDTMLASALTKRNGETVLQTRRYPDPEVGPGQALLEIRAAALNHLDLYTRAHHAADPSAADKIIGSDAAGVVREIGLGVEDLAPGDAVVLNPGLSCGTCDLCEAGEESECLGFDLVGRGVPGTYAGLVVVPAMNLAPKPAHLSFEEAAALPLAHLTAWRMVMNRGGLQTGETVLIHGIGGGVALAALQIAKLANAEVIVTSSADDKLVRARELGADHTVNYRQAPEVVKAVREMTDGKGVDLVVDSVGAATLPVSVSAARNGGRVVVCGATTGADVSINLREVFWRQITIIGSTMGCTDDFREMLATIDERGLVPVVDSVRHISDAGAALDHMETGEQFGKIVLSAGSDSGSWSEPIE
jgi:NADPH:quinone reductase-like Zn-dependent oxidoreductase